MTSSPLGGPGGRFLPLGGPGGGSLIPQCLHRIFRCCSPTLPVEPTPKSPRGDFGFSVLMKMLFTIIKILFLLQAPLEEFWGDLLPPWGAGGSVPSPWGAGGSVPPPLGGRGVGSFPLGGRGVGYSYLSASTGFFVAALELCQLTVRTAISTAENAAVANIHQLSPVL